MWKSSGRPASSPPRCWPASCAPATREAAGGRMTTPQGKPFLYAKPGFRNGDFVAYGGEV